MSKKVVFSEDYKQNIEARIIGFRRHFENECASNEFLEKWFLLADQARGAVLINTDKLTGVKYVRPSEKVRGTPNGSVAALFDAWPLCNLEFRKGTWEWLNFAIKAYRVCHSNEQVGDGLLLAFTLMEMAMLGEVCLTDLDNGVVEVRLGSKFAQSARNRLFKLEEATKGNREHEMSFAEATVH